MHFEGSHAFPVPREVLWKLLNDPAVLTRVTPGVRELQLQGEDRYQAVFDIKLGPVNSAFAGSLEVADKVPPESYRLLVQVDGKIGAVAAAGALTLKPENGHTLVSFAGDAQLSGVLARMGQRLLTGVARMFTSQFFKALEKELPA
jgi:carbon monoxide dehydrogenase subunit G